MIILNVLLVLLHINCHECIALDADMSRNENYMFVFVCFFQFIHLWSLRRTVPFSNRDRKKRKNTDDTPYSPTGSAKFSFQCESDYNVNWITWDYIHTVAARVGPTVPRQERPAREGARVASIETGLAAAAAKLSHQVNALLHLAFYYVSIFKWSQF